LDPASAVAAVSPRTKALLPTQLNGRTCDMDALQTVANKHGLLIIEDAAQALGSRFKGRCAGTFGVAGAISFYPAKTLGCLGDGGCVVTNDDATYERLVELHDHGRDTAGEMVGWGLNSRLDNLQAAILNFKLKDYAREVARRREIAARYRGRLESLRTVTLPPGPEGDPDHFDVYQNYEIEAERRDELRAFLKQRGVGTLIQWGGKAVHQFPKLGFTQHLPYTDKLFIRMLMLPMNTALSNEDVDYVCACIKEFYTE
jgi:dTDP-4-amino-4,6-dideoxygalactose transaminase